MSYDATKPTVVDNYSTGYTQKIRENFSYLLTMGQGDSLVGTPPTNAKRYDSSSSLFQYYTGSGWATLPLAYVSSQGGTVSGNLSVTGTLTRNGNSVWDAGNFTPSSKANVAGQAFTGAISTTSGGMTAAGRVEGNGGAGNGLGKITVSASAPGTGAQGDIHFQY